MSRKKAMFVGRWQPFHNGHKWLIGEKVYNGTPVLICVRDIPPDEKNPFTTEETVDMLTEAYRDLNTPGHGGVDQEMVKIMVIPDIESVNYGRGVGYEINEHIPPKNIGFISATQIREQIRDNDDSWKKNVDSKIHDKVVLYLSKSGGR